MGSVSNKFDKLYLKTRRSKEVVSVTKFGLQEPPSLSKKDPTAKKVTEQQMAAWKKIGGLS